MTLFSVGTTTTLPPVTIIIFFTTMSSLLITVNNAFVVIVDHRRSSSTFQRPTSSYSFSNVEWNHRRSRRCRDNDRFASRLRQKTNDDDDDDDDDGGEIFYNDFDGFVGDDIIIDEPPSDDDDTVATDDDDDKPLPPPPPSSFRRRLLLSENWKRGNWKVRGVTLDQYSSATFTDSDEERPVHVTLLSSYSPEEIIVGRTDGSLVVMRLGDETFASFTNVVKAEMNEEESTVRVGEVLARVEGEEEEGEGVPFEIVAQTVGKSEGGGVGALCARGGVIYGSREGEGVIVEWVREGGVLKETRGWGEGCHESDVHTLKWVDDDDEGYLISVSGDALALWDATTMEMRRRVRLSRGISSMDIANDDDASPVIFLGLDDGFVVGYTLHDLLLPHDGDEPPRECSRFKAYEDNAITALFYGGIVPSRSPSSSGVRSLLTGSDDGELKQWDLIPRSPTSSSSSSITFESWPRLPTQRLSQNRPHTFRSSHTSPITSITSPSRSIYLTAGSDGRILSHSCEDGSELYNMDGFSKELRSLICVEGLLITDGMGKVVCLHDFNVGMEEEMKGLIDYDDW